MVDVEPVSTTPLPLVDADRVATGVPAFTPVTAKSALAVDCPPMSRSTVELYG